MDKTLYVETTFRVIGKIKGQPLSPRETVIVPVTVNRTVISEDFNIARRIMLAYIDAGVRLKLAELFVSRLKTNTALKRTVGGTKWCVDLLGEVEEMPFYTEPANIGDCMKFFNVKQPYFIHKQIIHRNSAILQQINKDLLASESANDSQGKEAA